MTIILSLFLRKSVGTYIIRSPITNKKLPARGSFFIGGVVWQV